MLSDPFSIENYLSGYCSHFLVLVEFWTQSWRCISLCTFEFYRPNIPSIFPHLYGAVVSYKNIFSINWLFFIHLHQLFTYVTWSIFIRYIYSHVAVYYQHNKHFHRLRQHVTFAKTCFRISNNLLTLNYLFVCRNIP